MSGLSYLSEMTRGIGYGLYCSAIVFTRAGLAGTGYSTEPVVERLYQDILEDIIRQAKKYEDYLTGLINGGTPCSFIWPEVRRQISAFSAAHPKTAVEKIQKVLEVEFASQMQFPIQLIHRFVKGDRSQAVLNEINDFAIKLLVNPFHNELALDDIWSSFKFAVRDVCGGNENDLGALCQWMNRFSGGRLFKMTTKYMNEKFQTLRKEGVYIGGKVELNGIQYTVLEVLGREDPEGRGFLSCVAETPSGELKVLTLGAHPMSNCLRGDPQLWARYEEIRAKETRVTPEYGWKFAWSRPWLYPPHVFDAIVDGVGIADFLQVLNFSSWAPSETNREPLSHAQRSIVEKVGSLFVTFQELNILPNGLHEFEKLAVEFDGKGEIRQIAPIAICPFTNANAETLMRQIAGEGIEMFKLLGQAFKNDLEWDLRDRVVEMGASLIKDGDIPRLREDVIIPDVQFDQRNKITRVTKQLMDRRFQRVEIASAIGYWLQYTEVVLVSEWDRLEDDISHLLLALKDHAYPLPAELTPILEKMKTPVSPSKKHLISLVSFFN